MASAAVQQHVPTFAHSPSTNFAPPSYQPPSKSYQPHQRPYDSVIPALPHPVLQAPIHKSHYERDNVSGVNIYPLTPRKRSSISIWWISLPKRTRIILLVLTILVILGAAVGGGVGGSLAKKGGLNSGLSSGSPSSSNYCAPNYCTTNDSCRQGGNSGGFCSGGHMVNGQQCGRSCA